MCVGALHRKESFATILYNKVIAYISQGKNKDARAEIPFLFDDMRAMYCQAYII